MTRTVGFAIASGWLVLAWAGGELAAGPIVVVDNTAYFRHHSCSGQNRYSPAALRSEGAKVLTPAGLNRLQRDTERWLQQPGRDAAAGGWMANVYQPMLANFVPPAARPVDEKWAAADFDDSAWALRRGPFQSSRAVDITQPGLGQFEESMDLGVLHAYHRSALEVMDPARAALTFKAAYYGGIRALINGREIARGHLPAGELGAEPRGEDYPAAAYAETGSAARQRRIGPVRIAPEALRKGLNVLAVEVHASDFHPVVLKNPRQPNWGGPTRPWPHGQLVSVELRGDSAAVRSATVRPAGVQVWAADMHQQVRSDDFRPPGEGVGVLRFAAARNGTFSAQLVVAGDRPLAAVRVSPGPLRQAGGAASLPAACLTVLAMAPLPEQRWTMKYLGDERGMGASFPTAAELESFAAMRGPAGRWVFDELAAGPIGPVGANTARPVWLSLRVPADAAAGRYQGAVRVEAGEQPVDVPVELIVHDWALPAPKDFQTLVGCEENPYGVARQYGVAPWSERHWALVETSLAQLGRVGNRWVNVPVLVRTEYGNGDDSMIRWVRRRDRSWAFDYKVLDRYLDLHVKHCGRPRVINAVVMQGMKDRLSPSSSAGHVRVWDEAGGQSATMAMSTASRPAAAVAAWQAFARSLAAHMKDRGLADALYWGAPLESEADEELKNVLAEACPEVFWTAGPHEMMANGTYAKNARFYRLVTTIRYWGNWPAFRMNEGWRSQTTHLLNPRCGGTVFALHTTSLPFAYRVMPDHALAFGRNGFTRVGADEWAGIHYQGATVSKWQTGVPVLFVLWPGKEGAHSSARFEALLEGIQETEARISIEQAIHRGRLPRDIADRARKTLADNLHETMFFLGNSTIRAHEENCRGWRERSARLYATAGEVARAGRP